MKTVLMTAYAVNPYKGSEDGMGWNFILQAARFQRVIAVTRRNNGPHIERYLAENPAAASSRRQRQNSSTSTCRPGRAGGKRGHCSRSSTSTCGNWVWPCGCAAAGWMRM